MNISKRCFFAFSTLFLGFAILLTTCEWLDYPLDEFYREQTGTLAAGPVRVAADSVALGTDGVICVAPGTRTIVIPLDNPIGYAIQEEGLISFPSGLPAGVSAKARQSDDKNSIEITITGAAGDEFPINLTVKTAKEGRLLTEQTLVVACVDFETRLSASAGLAVTSPDETLNPVWNQDTKTYSVNNYPSPTAVIVFAKGNTAQTVTVFNPDGSIAVKANEGDAGPTVHLPVLGGEGNKVRVRVTAAHGAASGDYVINITRVGASNLCQITSFTVEGVTVTGIPLANGDVIDHTAETISVTVPYGTVLSTMTPTLEISPQATASPVSGTEWGSDGPAKTYTVTAEDRSTTKTYTVTVTRAASGNADLTGLTIDSSALSPAFNAATTSYTVSVANSVDSITVTPTKSDTHTSISVGKSGEESDTPSGTGKPVSLAVGNNTVTVEVTAQDGTTTKTYTITVTRAGSGNAELTGLTVNSPHALNETFNGSTASYTVNVANSVSSIDVTADKSDVYTKIRIDGTDYASGTTAQKTIGLNVGANTIEVTVTAQNGTDTKTYDITVNRAASGNANLTTLTVSSETPLSPGFAANTTSYAVNVVNSVTGIMVTAAKSDVYTKISIDGTDYNSGTLAQKTVNLNVGDNTVTIVVTAQDGTTTKTYTITVHRMDNNADLTSLAISPGTLNPYFDAGTTDYTARFLVSTVSSITVTAGKSGVYNKIKIAGTNYPSGTPAQNTVSLSPASNTIDIVVTAEDTTYTKTYTVEFSFYGVTTLAADMVQFGFEPMGVAVDSTGNVYVADVMNSRIRKITPGGVVTTLAGNGTQGFADGTGTEAQFNMPDGVAVDSEGNVYVAEYWESRIRKITSGGVVTTLAGNGTGGHADGTGTTTQFNSPRGVAVDSIGNVYVGDESNHCIRKISPNGVVTTFAGSAGQPGYVNGTGAAVRFSRPRGVAVDSIGNVYVGDEGNRCIRKITSDGVVTTLAGSGTSGYADGTGTAAQFDSLGYVAVDSAKNVYVGDTYNHRIRKITSDGVVTTLAGNGTHGYVDGDFLMAQFYCPVGVAVDSAGNVYVGDNNNSRIRKIVP